MKFLFGFVFILFLFLNVSGQTSSSDYTWWNTVHNWQEGDPGWRQLMIVTPGFMGPNALPVPDVKKGILDTTTEFEITASSHFNKMDPTQDLSGRFYIPFLKNKIAFEMYGVVLEHYNYPEKTRDERFSRDKDGKGWLAGDFYFSTLIQVFYDRKFPNTMVRLACKTASGAMNAARYTDSPGYFFDISFSKDYKFSKNVKFMPFGSFGFYSWQTYKIDTPQNDAKMFAFGTDFVKNDLLYSASLSGYSGYLGQHDRPLQLNFEARKDFSTTAFRIRWIYGLRDWNYKTLRFSFIWKFDSAN